MARSSLDCFDKSNDPIQSNTDVPSTMQHLKSCKCAQAQFANIRTGWDTAPPTDASPGDGCSIYCVLGSMLGDYQASIFTRPALETD